MSNTTKTSPADDLKPGDLITIKMKVGLFGNIRNLAVDHYAVYVGNGKVVHNRPGSGWMMSVGGGMELCLFEEFLGLSDEGSQWVKISDAYESMPFDGKDGHIPKFSGKETAARAVNRIGEKQFHLKNNNSEHFAMECRFGKHESNNQMRNAVLKRMSDSLV